MTEFKDGTQWFFGRGPSKNETGESRQDSSADFSEHLSNMRSAGVTLQVIADQYQLSVQAVWRRIKKANGGATKKSRMTSEHRDAVKYAKNLRRLHRIKDSWARLQRTESTI